MGMQFCEKCGAPVGTCACSKETTEIVMNTVLEEENEMSQLLQQLGL